MRPEKDDDDAYLRPYRLEIDATGGDHAAFRQWQRLQVTVAITTETELTREDEHEAAYQLVPMLIAAHCDGDRFLADRVDLRPDSSPGDTGSINGRPDESTERNVSAFVHRIASSFGSKVWLATDWETATILIGVAAPLPQELEQLNGTTVAGLRVDVFLADVTVNEYEAFIRAVGRAHFADKDKVCSFSITNDSTFIQVNIDRLSQMSADTITALQTRLENLTDARVVLIEAMQFHDLNYPPDQSDSVGC